MREPGQLNPLDAPPSENPRNQGLRQTVGVMLVLCGLAGAFWVVAQVTIMIYAPGEVSMLTHLSPQPTVLTRVSSSDVVLPGEFYVLMGYGINIVLLAICAGMATAAIRSGVYLLQQDVSKLAADLVRQLVDAEHERDRL